MNDNNIRAIGDPFAVVVSPFGLRELVVYYEGTPFPLITPTYARTFAAALLAAANTAEKGTQ